MEMFINGMLYGAGFALAYFIGMGVYTLIVAPIYQARQMKKLHESISSK